ncbi:hypothetical protein QPK87_25525 [Kamptonema cortianum]|nr:hypothetical protein [Oscillatoria laete-virens]MDK3159897.1 hypothetical protein [Kamptonema cortianum]MDL5050535.1 hypothetical protein [Oscillatoria amoena NRMC-F 0135]MDL5055547.1 hypothetical protein [Oscillatoria laete-virens NRMC-F 0139]
MNSPSPTQEIQIVALYLSPGHNYFGHHGKPAGENRIVPCEFLDIEAGKGILGDRFFDYKPDYKGQVTFFEEETFLALGQLLGVGGKDMGVFRRNVITRGIDLNSLIGKTFTIQGVEFLGAEEAKPCYWMNQAFAPGAEEALRGKGGLRAKALSSGRISIGAAALS